MAGCPSCGRANADEARLPLPVDGSIERIRALGAGHGPLEQAWERGVIGRLYAMKGDFARARELAPGAFEAYTEAGLLQTAGGSRWV